METNGANEAKQVEGQPWGDQSVIATFSPWGLPKRR
jgi:hypothetical protein